MLLEWLYESYLQRLLSGLLALFYGIYLEEPLLGPPKWICVYLEGFPACLLKWIYENYLEGFPSGQLEWNYESYISGGA